MQTQSVRVIRAFYFQRKLIKAGSIVELPKVFAIEVCAANKAELTDEKPRTEGRPDAK